MGRWKLDALLEAALKPSSIHDQTEIFDSRTQVPHLACRGRRGAGRSLPPMEYFADLSRQRRDLIQNNPRVD